MDPESGLSMLNPEPAKLPGPDLIHGLVTPPCQSKSSEHLGNGTRTSLTYDELHKRADAVASRLSHVVGYGDGQFVVPVLIEQSPALYATLLGILKSGGAFCPLNIDAPPERVRFILEDVSAKAVLVSAALQSSLPSDLSAEIIVAEHALEFPDEPLGKRDPRSEDLAYVMYTSGSTGTPKGVGVSHGAASQALLAHGRHMPSFSRFLQFAAPTFDVSVFEIFFPMTRGSTLISARRSELLNDLPGVMREMDVDACELTPTVAGSLLRTRGSVPKLKLMLTIGEMLTEPVIREFGGDHEKESILWAITLQTSMSTSSTVRNIGHPLDTVSCFVIRPLDGNGSAPFEILPQGEIGELAVGGHQLATGYLNRPEQTAAAFISTPYGRLYRTGDKARMLSDGNLECLGRLSDGQVKLRGQRLELGEVQEAILRTPGCHGAVAVVHDSILVAFCATDSGVLEDAIFGQCQRWLPRFMIPGEVVIMDAFPKLPSGKVDKRKLVSDFVEQKNQGQTSSAETTLSSDIPPELTTIVGEYLNIRLDSRTLLPSAGLDSLKSIGLASTLRAAGFKAEVAMLLKTKTLTDLWIAMQAVSEAHVELTPAPDISLMAERGMIAAENPSLRQVGHLVEDIIPCVPLQSAMLVETAHRPDMYWNEVELEADAGPEEVLKAFQQVVQENQALRTGFISWNGDFVSLIFKELSQEQLSIMDDFESDPPHGSDTELLRTLRIQIKTQDSGHSSRVLLHIHHAIYDGWSMDMVLADLSSILKGAPQQERPQFRQIPNFYHSTASMETFSPSKAFWAEHLAGWSKDPFPKLMDDAADKPSSHVTIGFLKVPIADVETLSQGLGCSIQVVFQAALSVVWSGILGSTDIVLGTVTSGRTSPIAGIERIVGPCIASLPLRVDFGKMTETVHLFNHIQSTNRAMLTHSVLPLSEIRRLTDLQPGDALELQHLDRLETKLLIEVEPLDDGFAIRTTHHSDSMTADMARHIIDQLKTVFRQILSCPRSGLAALKRCLSHNPANYNDPPVQFKGIPDLASMVESVAERCPNAPAICFAESDDSGNGISNKIISYEELNILSNRIAHFMLSGGMGTRQVIGIIMEKSITLYASILAIVKAGCAYLPVLPSTPTDRVRNIFDQAKVRHCLVDGTSSTTFKSVRDVRFVNVEGAPLSDFQEHNLGIPADGSRLAYVIYTSGTTGAPKGVAITQMNIASNIHHLNTVYPKSVGKQARLLQACSQAFDVSVFEIFYTWYTGMCLCAGTNDTIFEDLEHAIRELQITHLSLTPTVASLIKPENTPTVEFLVTAGEPMTQGVLDQWGELLWQGYGPSETTNICSVKRMTKGMPIAHLGWTFPNTSVFVLTPGSSDAVPLGWVGEFCFAGDQVAQGYLNLPQTTAERFIDHPKFGRIYRSGDIGRMLPDGSLMILSRLDDQLKLRGQRIEAGEISSIITTTEAASSAVTILGRRQGTSSEQLVSFYVLPEDTPGNGVLDIDIPTTRLLFSALQSYLPSYMVPSYLVPLARIPLTSSGKLDRRRLQDWFRNLPSTYLEAAALPSQESGDGGGWSHTEVLVAEAIAQTTGVPKSEVNRWTPFANLGIDSISAIGLASHLSTHLGRRVPISSIIRNPNPVQLARCLDDEQLPTKSPTTRSFLTDDFIQSVRESFASESKEVATILPCTPLQEAMLSGGQRSYYNRIMLRLQVGGDEMRDYWSEMVRRHEILRTCFVTTPDVNRPIAQVALQNWDIPWQSFEVTTPSFDGVVDEHLQKLPRAVDSKIPPVSLAIIGYRGSTFLSFICHHALYDGVAVDTLWREVEALANGRSLPPPVPYYSFLQEMLDLPDDVQSFWKTQLQGFRSSNLFAITARTNSAQAVHTKSLRTTLGTLRARVTDLGVSLLSLCQGAWANTLAVAYSSSDVCFGNVVSGRNVDIEGVERLVAPCFNTIPVRADLSTKVHGNDLVKHFYKLNVDLLPYQFTPLRLVQKLANRQGRGLFETLLLLQKPLHKMDDRVWILEGDSGDMDMPLVCEVVPCPDLNTVVVNMHYDMDIVDPTSATALLDVFEHLLESLLEKPYAALATRETLPPTLGESLQTFRVRKEKPETTEPGTSTIAWTEVELKIREVLVELSQHPASRVLRHTTIFELGLDSINAVQVASMLRRGGLKVSASDVIEYPSCSRLADRVSASRKGQESSRLLPYDLESFAQSVSAQAESKLPSGFHVEAVLPCTPMQCAMVTSFIQSDGRNYFNSLTYEVEERFKLDDLAHAWERLCVSHPMLRTAFVPVTHPHSTFAMLRYSPSSTDIPLNKVEDGIVAGPNPLQNELRDKFLANPHLPPWHVLLQQSDERLFMTLFIHHALYDAQSLDGLLSSLWEILDTGESPLIPRIEPGLMDLMSQSTRAHTEAEEFWEAKAKDTVVNSFPVMTPLREAGGPLVVESDVLSLPFSELQQATQMAGITVQAVIQAAWVRILSSYLGEASVVFGVTLSGRTAETTQDAPFPCLVTLPVVASSISSNTELLQCMMDYNTHMHKSQFAPLSQVQKWLGHAASPVFDTLISYHRTGRNPSSRGFQLVRDEASVEYPVSLEIEAADGDRVRISVIFKPDTLPREQAKLIIQQFDAILSHLTLHPDGTDDDLYREVPEVHSQLPPQTPNMASPVRYMHEFVESRAKSEPDAVALEFVDSHHFGRQVQRRRWTYRELDEMGNRVAHSLAAIVPVNSIVAIHFNKCPEAYFSILGILKAGCSFVALDPTAPEARKKFILEDSQAQCLLTGSGTEMDWAMEGQAAMICITDDHLRDFPVSSRILDEDFTPSSTCYCLYTSGTTGTPKGCEITHENAVQAMMAFQELFQGHWDDDSRWLQFAALHFDVSVLEQYWSWSVGITVVAAPKDMILDDLAGSINKLGITHIDLTPSLARLTHPDEVPSLCKGVFITGGESLKQEILDAWGPKAVIYNAYGPTEATIGVSMYQRVPISGRPSNIGKQFPNVGSYVFQPGTEIPVLRGGVGELCVSGKLVGKGYLGRPELTQERFPTLKHFKERVYRTGDLVRLLHDGCFDFLGRADDQVKLRGQRLEIGEINHAIRGVPEISDAATVVTSHGSSDKSVLVSFIVPRQEDRATNLEILQPADGLDIKAREACRSRLPGYMVPTYIFQLPYIPLSVNNKAEVKELRRLFAELSHARLMALVSSTSSSSGTDGKVLKRIIQVLAEFSSVKEDEISEEMSIFDIGVDSISALRLSTLFKNRGFHEASPAKILRNPVVQDLTWALAKSATQSQDKFVKECQQRIRAFGHRYISTACRVLGVSPSDIEHIAPCSPLQQGIISKSLALEDKGAYFNSFELRLGPELHPDQLRKAWYELIASESILRTAFLATASGFIQVAITDGQVLWKNLALDSEEEVIVALETEKEDWVRRNGTHVVEPLRFIHVRTPGTESLHIQIFHGIYDGNSFDLMLSRIAGYIRGHEAARGPPFIQALSHGPLWSFDHCRPFWIEHLRDWTSSAMPSLSSATSTRSSVASRVLSANQIASIRKAHSATLQAVVLALWTSVLQQYHPSGLTIGVIVSGRSVDLPGAERTVGPLFNTIPFFHRTSEGLTFASLIQKCHDFGASVLPFQHVPLQKIQKWCSKGRPLFDTLFTLQLEPEGEDTHRGLWDVRAGDPTPDYPLAVEFKGTREGEICVSLVAQGETADDSTLGSMLDQVEKRLQLMAARTEDRVPIPNTAIRILTESPVSVSQTHEAGKEGGFSWTVIATTIRQEVAALAGTDPGEVGASTSMLELGLDSIDIIKLAARLRGKKIDMAASQIMRLQTVSKMSELAETSFGLDKQADADLDDFLARLWDKVQNRGLDMTKIETVLPATPLQESMVAAMVESDFEWYFNHEVLEVRDAVDLQRLRAAWERVVGTFPILRTGFLEIEEHDMDMAYCQVVFKESQPWQENVSGGLTETDGLIERAKARAKSANTRYDLFQISSLTCGSRSYIVLSIAHALYDGWSLGLIYRELDKAYNGSLPETTNSEPLLKKILNSSNTKSGEFWADYLLDATPSLIPEVSTDSSIVQRLQRVSSISTERIQSLCKNTSISLQVLCQACWAAVLARLTKQLDVNFGVVISGRDFEGAEDLVFPTMNTVVVRCILHGTALEFLQYLEENMGDVREHQLYPLRKALQAAKAPAGGLFNSLFLLQRFDHGGSQDALFKSVEGSSAVDYPLCVEAETVGDNLVWRAACHSQLFSETEVSDLVAEIDQVMTFFVKSLDSEILSFTDDRVSICGLSAVQLRLDDGLDQPSSKQSQPEEEIDDWSGTSITIRDILARVSGIPESEIRLSHTLYNLGLDSITAIKVSSLLRRKGVGLSPRDLIGASSILHLADIADSKTKPRQSSGKVEKEEEEAWMPPRSINMDELMVTHGLREQDVDAALPALPMQVFMLGTWQQTRGAVFYPEFRYLLQYPCNKDAIDAAWEATVLSTPVLRTCFVATGDTDYPVFQVILKGDMAGAPRAMVGFKADWDKENNAWILQLKIHHALYDGVSLPAVMHKLARTIAGDTTHDDGKISQWIRYTASRERDAAKAARKAFWTNYLSGCPVAPDLPSERRTDYSIKRVSHIQRSALRDSRRLRRHASRHGLSVQSLFLAAYAKVLLSRERAHDLVGDDAVGTGGAAAAAATNHPHDHGLLPSPPPVVFGIYLANRSWSHDNDDDGSDDLPASYPRLNLVPLRVDAGGGRPLESVAAAIQRDLGEINSGGRADVGLWEVDAWTGVRVSSFVNFLSLPDEEAKPSPVVLRTVEQGLASQALEPVETAFPMGDIVVKHSFPPAIDIEASLQGSNAGLDIGVFGPSNLLGDEDAAAGLIAQIVSVLQMGDGDGK
ncbi:Hydroxamate-type ferrichrome siderophore peptide synthetase-like protein [Hapsidospora chrysogenum ATCC 11550]|uniref:Hydroxamate-type ferrichrome siderophore peptide synthetase-like protein n=1 Tax=Hapsidospora chrysogenum (strain ATCC 11550 / CBS 779.69 / DSM 880 / IAM 14645 / JCM 23072 / IMI 49137) TaxID=857340 RepID=A0A086T3P4_HAPC1|nr:Hydroxamate-type ferrichrome siderophore peptide synthetase-like protein [Hapsidospora chrysogenum ATCC 11550]